MSSSTKPDNLALDPSDKGQHFRDTISTISAEGRRNWLYPRKPRGWYYNVRSVVSWVLIGFLFAGPFIKINGQPIILLNILDRKFVLFGTVFWTQDFHILAIGMLALIIFIVLFTAIYGRLFCGWVCPQTIFMEMLFRKIEYAIEGDAPDQKRLNRSPLTFQKIMKKGAKLGIFFGISFLIANIFLAYIIGADALWEIVTDDPREHLTGLTAITLFSFAFFGVFSRFREQVCIVACPYGRLQSVLVDNSSIAVTYDFARGEDRALLNVRQKEKRDSGAVFFTNNDKADPARKYGDCIDCYQCVKVCPTGIDIRNGIQLECINCTACMDACDEIMVKTDRPTGLVRYASFNSIKEGIKTRLVTPRIAGYMVLFTIVFGVFVYFLGNRPDAEAVILREPGRTWNALPGGAYSNFYNVKIFNKTLHDQPVEVRLLRPDGEIQPLGMPDNLLAHDLAEGRFMVFLHGSELLPGRTPIEFGLYSGDRLIHSVPSVFIGPQSP